MAKEDKIIDFESSLKKLGSIVEKLEDENINLEDSVKSFEEGMNLVKKYDGEFPKKYFEEVLDYMMIDKRLFWKTIDKFRAKHLWKKNKNKWKLLYTAYGKPRDY